MPVLFLLGIRFHHFYTDVFLLFFVKGTFPSCIKWDRHSQFRIQCFHGGWIRPFELDSRIHRIQLRENRATHDHLPREPRGHDIGGHKGNFVGRPFWDFW